MAAYRESVVIFIDCADPALLWSGVGDLSMPADIVLPVNMIAIGGDELISVPDIEQLMNGTAQREELTLSGVSDRIVELAVDVAAEVENAPVHIGVVRFNPDWSLDVIEWEAVFEARSLSVNRPTAENPTRSITLTIVAGDTRRSRPPSAYFTPADQKRRPGSEDDTIFDNVPLINAGTSRPFGPSDA